MFCPFVLTWGGLLFPIISIKKSTFNSNLKKRRFCWIPGLDFAVCACVRNGCVDARADERVHAWEPCRGLEWVGEIWYKLGYDEHPQGSRWESVPYVLMVWLGEVEKKENPVLQLWVLSPHWLLLPSNGKPPPFTPTGASSDWLETLLCWAYSQGYVM